MHTLVFVCSNMKRSLRVDLKTFISQISYFGGKHLTGSGSPLGRTSLLLFVGKFFLPLSQCWAGSEDTLKCRYLPVNKRNYVPSWALFSSFDLQTKLRKSVFKVRPWVWAGLRGEERRGGFKCISRPNSFFWFEVKAEPLVFIYAFNWLGKFLFVGFSERQRFSHTGSFVFVHIFGEFFCLCFLLSWRAEVAKWKAAHRVGTDRWSWSWKWRLLSRRNAARSEDSSKLLSETWR